MKAQTVELFKTWSINQIKLCQKKMFHTRETIVQQVFLQQKTLQSQIQKFDINGI